MQAKKFANSAKTLGLFVVMWLIIMAIGGAIAGGTGNATWIWVFAGIGVISTFVSYWNSATMALKAMRAYQVTPHQAPELYRIVSELSSELKMPMPTVWIAPTQSPNAFATGRNPKNAAVCCTEGILQILDERELRGVLGHELMHVYNRDILTASVAAAMSGIISSLAQFALMFGGGRGRNNSGGGNIISSLLMVILAPMAAAVVRMAISRTREYSADQGGADLTGEPMALARALQKISGGVNVRPMASSPEKDTVSAMMIANPFRGGGMQRLFSTHPPMEDRVERLAQQARSLGLDPGN